MGSIIKNKKFKAKYYFAVAGSAFIVWYFCSWLDFKHWMGTTVVSPLADRAIMERGSPAWKNL